MSAIKDLIKWTFIGMGLILVLFMTFMPPKTWTLYIDYFLVTPIWYWIPQTTWLIIGGFSLGSCIYLLKELA